MRFASHASPKDRRAAVLFAGLCSVLATIASAKADVMEIRPDGDVAVYSGPTIWSAADVRLIGEQKDSSRLSIARKHDPRIAETLRHAAARHEIAEQLLGAVAWRESRWNRDAVSSKGARGLMQLMPATAAALHVSATDLNDNADGGARYLSGLMQRFHGDLICALAAYNAGPAAVIRYRGVPPYPETQKYVAAIMDRLADISLGQPLDGASR